MKRLLITMLLLPTIALAHQVSNNIRIVKLSQMEFPEAMKKNMANYNNNIKKQGYSSSDSTYPRELMRMSYVKQNYSTSKDNEDTELKKNISDIKLNFEYPGVSKTPIGYAPLGMYTPNGWAGIKEFFEYKPLGICTLSLFNISQANEPMQLNEDGLRYDVNDKPTSLSAEGSNNSGFIYSVRWFDAKFVHDLECANNLYDKDKMDKMIILAKEIDSSLDK